MMVLVVISMWTLQVTPSGGKEKFNQRENIV